MSKKNPALACGRCNDPAAFAYSVFNRERICRRRNRWCCSGDFLLTDVFGVLALLREQSDPIPPAFAFVSGGAMIFSVLALALGLGCAARTCMGWRSMAKIGSLLLGTLLLLCSNLGARAESVVGTVSRVQNQAQVGTEAAVVGTPVHMNDRLRTGPNARLQVTFHDSSSLTLGENANVVVDRFVFSPQKSSAEVALKASAGALRFAGAQDRTDAQKKHSVNTPVAALAVRGTHFWAGPIDGQYGVLLLNGKLGVSNRAGAVTLASPGMGTDIPLRRVRKAHL
jgi:hypothetical protein